MARESIEFSIGSVFRGEGFEKAQQALKANSREIQSSVRGLGSLSTAFSEISPAVGGAVSSVSAFAKAFTSGGIVGGIIETSLIAISYAVRKVTEKVREAEEATKKYASLLLSSFGDAAKKSAASFGELKTSIASANKESKDLLAVLNGNSAAEAANKVHEIRMKKFDDLDAAMTDAERSLIEEAAKREEAMVKAKLADTKAANAVEAYKTAVERTTELKTAAAQNLSVAEEQLARATEMSQEYTTKRNQVENYLATQEQRFADGTIGMAELMVARKNSALKISELEEQYKDNVSALAAANESVKNARNEVGAAESASVEAHNSLNAAIQARTETENAIVELDRESVQNMDAINAATMALIMATKEPQEAIIELVDPIDDAKEGFKHIAGVCGDISELLEDKKDTLASGGGDGSSGSGGELKVKVTNPNDISSGFSNTVNIDGLREDIKLPRGLDSETAERIRNGTASIADFNRLDRYMEREERDAQSSLHRVGSDAVRFLKNADRPDSWLSDRDKQFQSDFKSRVLPQLPKDVAKELLGDAGKKLLTTESMTEILKDKNVIDSWLGSLGLK